ncbi:MAG: LysR family transcriptional regulator [Planctomycetes bacterium]|nr:LysR family transcriptional regulator [Planctomycetota bacterium]
MELHELRLFKAVVDQRGFARAAETSFLTQSAVSQAVRRLEDELKARLLTRTRPPAPTPAGARLYELAGDLLAREAAARRDVEEIAKGGTGVLTLGASQALSREVLPGLVREFHARRPRAAVHLETLPSRELVRVVADGRLELGLGPFQKHMPGFERRALGQQRMVLYVARRAPWRRALERQGEAALRDVPLVTSSLDAPGARPGGGRLRERFRTVWVVHSMDVRLELVRAGLAVGYLPESTVALAARPRDLVPVAGVDFGVIRRDVGLFWLAKRPLSEAGRELVAGARLTTPPRSS